MTRDWVGDRTPMHKNICWVILKMFVSLALLLKVGLPFGQMSSNQVRPYKSESVAGMDLSFAFREFLAFFRFRFLASRFFGKKARILAHLRFRFLDDGGCIPEKINI